MRIKVNPPCTPLVAQRKNFCFAWPNKIRARKVASGGKNHSIPQQEHKVSLKKPVKVLSMLQ